MYKGLGNAANRLPAIYVIKAIRECDGPLWASPPSRGLVHHRSSLYHPARPQWEPRPDTPTGQALGSAASTSAVSDRWSGENLICRG
jgi:hypothetical protein